MNQTEAQIRRRESAKKAVLRAMIEGRHIDLTHGEEFNTSQMHTTICKIRKELASPDSHYFLMDRWTTTPEGVRMKEYWVEPRKN